MTNPEARDISELATRNDKSYTHSEVKARNIITFGAILEGKDLTPHEAGDVVIELANRIKRERTRNGNKTG